MMADTFMHDSDDDDFCAEDLKIRGAKQEVLLAGKTNKQPSSPEPTPVKLRTRAAKLVEQMRECSVQSFEAE